MKRIPSTLLIVVLVAALAVFSATLIHALWYAPEIDSGMMAATSTPHAVPPEEQPARLLIPKLKIDASVQYVGVNAKGNMGVPNNFTDVAWYKYGTAPGQDGSAVIDGHVDNGLSLAGVFKHLADIAVGDDVYVQEKNGTTLHFVVESVQTYDYKSVPLALVFNRSGAAYLNLITCDGTWVKNEKTYNERLVVFTRLVS